MPGKKNADRGPTALPKNRGTGFEEYFADPPMTAAEAEEEREEIYSPLIPFPVRIQSCIQRFRARRRINNSNAIHCFDQYLFLGGVDTSPRMFGGNNEAEIKEMTAEERREATAADTVYNSNGGDRFYNADDPEGWDIDFAGIAAGFFSENLPSLTSWDYHLMGKVVGLIESFLLYILQHDVCTEYNENVKEALTICNKAKAELPLAHQALIRFPGQYNLALAEMSSESAVVINENSSIADDSGGFRRPKQFDPKAVVTFAMATTEDKSCFAALEGGLKVIEEEDCSLEVVEIYRATGEVCDIARLIQIPDKMPNGFAPIGKIVLKPCHIEDGYDHGDALPSDDGEPVTFLVDDNILARLLPGFRLQLRVAHLNVGVKFIKQVHAVYVAWHIFLPQNLMVHFKEPIENERPAPSVTSPDAEQENDAPSED